MWRTFLLGAALFCTVTAYSQTKIVVRPQFDPALSSPFAVYPFKHIKRPKVALVLTGGGARGIAQIGVLKTLEHYHIPVDFISATSLGAIVGGLYAAGYSVAQLESLALHTDWDDVLSLTEDTKRSDLFFEQKLAEDWSFLTVRFQGLEPVLPPAISTGQRLTNFISRLTLQGIYHPQPSFDDLRIHFRASTTDLVSGKRVILSSGSLAEALRASATVPLLFTPVEKDSMQLIDGGLLSNIPVDVARNEGYDIVIAVNSTSSLRRAEQLKTPWQTADQIMGIMMQLSNEQQLRRADVVIEPAIGTHLASDFTGLDSLISKGEESAQEHVDEILALYSKKLQAIDADTSNGERPPVGFASIQIGGEGLSDSVIRSLRAEAASGNLTLERVSEQVRSIYSSHVFKEVYAGVYLDGDATRVEYHVELNPRLYTVDISGAKVVPVGILRSEFDSLLGKVLTPQSSVAALERMIGQYRSRGYSLARVTAHSFDERTGTLHLVIDEGIIGKVDVHGGVRTEVSFLQREFPLEEGDIFRIDGAERGVTNVAGTNLYEFVYLEVYFEPGGSLIVLRISELPSQLIRFGLHADNERNLQGAIDIRDQNFHGTGAELGLTALGGGRNALVNIEYKTPRILSLFTLSINAFYSFYNRYLYVDEPNPRPNHWSRARIGEYSEVDYGGKVVVGSQLERLGNVTAEFAVQNERVNNIDNSSALASRYRLSMLRFGSVIDTKDAHPFPTSGIGLSFSYEFALKILGSEIGYNALKIMYESYSSFGDYHTIHPKITFGFADRTMPLGQQFSLGGRKSLFGTREDDRRGRQLLVVNFEYRFLLPIRILFDTYVRFRYDLGSISSVPEEIKLSTFRHGIGGEIGFDTPIGEAAFGAGKSFFFGKDLPDNPIQQGPLLFYFTIGYQM